MKTDRNRNNLTIEDFEIMAPAGSWESLHAAIEAGANSVYFGIENLNMRSHSSNNFTVDDLREIVLLCQQNKVKSYLTINTIIYDNDITLMRQIVDTAKEVGISATLLRDADEFVKIPLSGNIGSLNASVAASILMYEVVRQRSV